MLEHCTLPRTGALEVILDILGPNATRMQQQSKSTNNGFNAKCQDKVAAAGCINKICDVTIAYPQGSPLDLFQIVFGSRPACVTHVHYRLFDVKDVNLDFYFLQ